jgi:tripartite-type tricarboxylate transporter receptor subunit TctC
MFYTFAVAQPQIKVGKLRAIAVTGLKRDPHVPELPTMDESGVRGFEATGWNGLFAPAGTPREIVERINAVVAKILNTQEIRELWASQSAEVVVNTPAQVAQRFRNDYTKYENLVKAAGIKPE